MQVMPSQCNGLQFIYSIDLAPFPSFLHLVLFPFSLLSSFLSTLSSQHSLPFSSRLYRCRHLLLKREKGGFLIIIKMFNRKVISQSEDGSQTIESMILIPISSSLSSSSSSSTATTTTTATFALPSAATCRTPTTSTPINTTTTLTPTKEKGGDQAWGTTGEGGVAGVGGAGDADAPPLASSLTGAWQAYHKKDEEQELWCGLGNGYLRVRRREKEEERRRRRRRWWGEGVMAPVLVDFLLCCLSFHFSLSIYLFIGLFLSPSSSLIAFLRSLSLSLSLSLFRFLPLSFPLVLSRSLSLFLLSFPILFFFFPFVK